MRESHISKHLRVWAIAAGLATVLVLGFGVNPAAADSRHHRGGYHNGPGWSHGGGHGYYRGGYRGGPRHGYYGGPRGYYGGGYGGYYYAPPPVYYAPPPAYYGPPPYYYSPGISLGLGIGF